MNWAFWLIFAALCGESVVLVVKGIIMTHKIEKRKKLPEAKGVKDIVCCELADIIRAGFSRCGVARVWGNVPEDMKPKMRYIQKEGKGKYKIVTWDFYNEADEIAERIYEDLFEEG